MTLKIGAAEAATLAPFEAPPPETTWRPGKQSFMTRLGNKLRGKG